MARYVDIECDAVTEVLPRRAFKTRQDIQDFLDNIPTADVAPVVRCKECQYAVTAWKDVYACTKPHHLVPGDHFCAFGAKMDGGADNAAD